MIDLLINQIKENIKCLLLNYPNELEFNHPIHINIICKALEEAGFKKQDDEEEDFGENAFWVSFIDKEGHKYDLYYCIFRSYCKLTLLK